ncbi:MAG: B12-binding domain-containing radical SAM protein, partial [Promethearchaeota archaeon]
ILYLTAILDSNNIPVDILDLEQYLDFDEIEVNNIIREQVNKYKIFGITSLTNTFNLALDFAKIIKNQNENNYVILGGPHVSFMYKDILEDNPEVKDLIDFICIGEAENSFLELVKVLLNQITNNQNSENFDIELSSVQGIAYLDSKGNLRVNNDAITTDLELLPLPARYKLTHEYFYYTIANVIVNRGCPNQCSFCSRQKLFKTTKIRSIESILSEVRDILSMQNYTHINFYDNININRSFFRNFCNMFIENKINIPWGCEIRIDTITDENARLLKNAGCRLVATGIESASIEVLQTNFKYQNPKEVVKGFKNLKNYNIPVQAYFVLGLPGETEDTFQKTVKYIQDLPLDENDRINYFIATPYPGSRLWDERDKFEIRVIEKNFSNYDCEHLIFETPDLNLETLEELFNVAKKLEEEFNRK